jgi:branched-chain amino acid transport system substrate-binding protein
MAFPGVQELISTYQANVGGSQADALGYYVAPCAYAQLQVIEQAIRGTDGLNDADLAKFTHAETFHTVMGDVKFSSQGEWDKPRVLTVQFQDIGSNDIEDFRGPEARIVVAPGQYSSGSLRTFSDAKRAGR